MPSWLPHDFDSGATLKLYKFFHSYLFSIFKSIQFPSIDNYILVFILVKSQVTPCLNGLK